ncbi:MAG TPA: hypothetical protein PKD32_09515 [Saprospiraceae bacterium]|nr:hypothetical protein [Saprospiraceae bacterium]
MKNDVLKPIAGGILLGLVLFFTGPLLLIILLLKFIFTPFGMGRMMMYHRLGGHNAYLPDMRLAFADKIRGMDEEEYLSFKERMNGSFCGKNDFNVNKNI